MGYLLGRTAIISGGLGDIGRAIALALAQQGANIALGDVRDPAQAEPLLAQLQAQGVRARYDVADVSDPDAVEAWYRAAESDPGTPDLIIVNAAVVTLTDILSISPAQWRRELAVNLDGAFYMAQSGAKRLVARGMTGRIVFLGSWVACAPRPHIPAYCVSKAGLRMLCKQFALALATKGILVNEVAPGNVDAGLSAQIFRQQPELKRNHLQMIPVRRMIEPEEVALQVAHLCHPENRQMTGSVLLMDGGLSLLSDAGPQE
jgi:NAD(P)-dependent dehydrogenase (short-subunit alcohol dehydrogenase family)